MTSPSSISKAVTLANNGRKIDCSATGIASARELGAKVEAYEIDDSCAPLRWFPDIPLTILDYDL